VNPYIRMMVKNTFAGSLLITLRILFSNVIGKIHVRVT